MTTNVTATCNGCGATDAAQVEPGRRFVDKPSGWRYLGHDQHVCETCARALEAWLRDRRAAAAAVVTVAPVVPVIARPQDFLAGVKVGIESVVTPSRAVPSPAEVARMLEQHAAVAAMPAVSS